MSYAEYTITDEVADWYRSLYPETKTQEWVDGNRYADIVVPELGIAVEVESDPGKYREGIGQALHYGRVGYTPVLALPMDRDKVTDPDTDEGEALNVCADARVGLVGIRPRDWEIGYVLRPFDP